MRERDYACEVRERARERERMREDGREIVRCERMRETVRGVCVRERERSRRCEVREMVRGDR